MIKSGDRILQHHVTGSDTKLSLESLGIVHDATVLDDDACGASCRAGRIEHVCDAAGLRAVGQVPRRGEAAAIVVGDDEPRAGRAHHIVDAFARQRRFGRDVCRSAFPDFIIGTPKSDA